MSDDDPKYVQTVGRGERINFALNSTEIKRVHARFVIDLWQHENEWQADCGNDHARGQTPEKAVSRLVVYMIAKQKP